MTKDNTTQQVKTLRGGVPINTAAQFGQPNGNPRNNGGIPKYVREIREELKGLLDPNLSMEDYQEIVANSNTDSGLRAVFAEAVVNKDSRTIIELINQAWGRPKESVDVTSNGETIGKSVEVVWAKKKK